MNQKINHTLAWSVVGIIALIIIAILTYQAVISQEEINKTARDMTEKAVDKPTQNITSYVGEVQEKGDDYIIINVPAQNNPISKDKVVKVIVDTNTEVMVSIIPKKIDATQPPEEIQKLFKTQNASFKDIEVGDTVLVFSSINIAGKSEFAANRINIRRVQ